MKIKKALLCAAIVFVAAVMTSCGDEPLTVRYLNFKPEAASAYEELAEIYEQETGVRIKVETAGNSTYEQTLSVKMANAEAPTLFQITGPRGYQEWKDYCADLSDTEIYAHLSDKDMAIVGEDGGVYGIPYVIEGYGIMYNTSITDKYFALPARSTSFASMDEINNFDKLKALVEDMQAHKEELGIDGVFASTSLKTGEAWRWTTHLANMPIYYEFKTENIQTTSDDANSITLEYGDNFKNIFDLYTDNSVVDKKILGTKTVTDAVSEFALGKCAMIQNGTWSWSQLTDLLGDGLEGDDIKFLPIYTGVEGEENQGLCIGTENFYAINSHASEEEQKAAADFVYWLYSSDVGKKYVTEQLGFIAPFDTFSEDEIPSDPLAADMFKWMNDDSKYTVTWAFTAFPSEMFKTDLGAGLLRYVQGEKDWDTLMEETVESWKTECDALNVYDD